MDEMAVKVESTVSCFIPSARVQNNVVGARLVYTKVRLEIYTI